MSAIRTFTVTVASADGGNKYFIDGVQQDTVNLAEGYTYVFNYPLAHPFRFSTTSDGTHSGGDEYTTGVTVNSSTQVQITVAASAPSRAILILSSIVLRSELISVTSYEIQFFFLNFFAYSKHISCQLLP